MTAWPSDVRSRTTPPSGATACALPRRRPRWARAKSSVSIPRMRACVLSHTSVGAGRRSASLGVSTLYSCAAGSCTLLRAGGEAGALTSTGGRTASSSRSTWIPAMGTRSSPCSRLCALHVYARWTSFMLIMVLRTPGCGSLGDTRSHLNLGHSCRLWTPLWPILSRPCAEPSRTASSRAFAPSGA